MAKEPRLESVAAWRALLWKRSVEFAVDVSGRCVLSPPLPSKKPRRLACLSDDGEICSRVLATSLGRWLAIQRMRMSRLLRAGAVVMHSTCL